MINSLVGYHDLQPRWCRSRQLAVSSSLLETLSTRLDPAHFTQFQQRPVISGHSLVVHATDSAWQLGSNFHPKPPRLPSVSGTASSKSASEKCQTTQQPLYNCRSIGVSWHSHLRTKGFHWSKALLPACLAEGNYGENAKSSLGVIYAISVFVWTTKSN